MKKLIFTLGFILGITSITNAQVGAMATFDAAQAANMGTSITQASEIISKGTETVNKLSEQAKKLDEQSKFIRDAVEKIDEGVKTLNVVNEIKKNTTGVYNDYNVAIDKLNNLKMNASNETTEFIDIQISNVLSLVAKNNQTTTDFTSLLSDDFLKMDTASRIEFLETINKKVMSVRLSIRSTVVDTSKKITQQNRKKQIYSVPTLK